jgi:ribosome-associated translation inhibitor RaiA
MQTPLQITMRDMQHSALLDERIREKATTLEKIYGRIIGCHVTVERVRRHQHQGQLFNVHVRVTLPQGEIAVNRKEHENIHVALRDTFDAARRRLEDYAHKHHDKAMAGHSLHRPDSSEPS